MSASSRRRNQRSGTQNPRQQASRWVQMRDDARAERKRKRKPPYLFDGTTPPTPIHEPDTVWQVLTLAALLDGQQMPAGRIRELFQALCGDGFDAVWAVVKDEPAEVLWPLFEAINTHFNALPDPNQVGELPGG
ncbi:hypothetical protein [Nocardia transvalensis]|uniref:hypothetical protein n=1 Tax=Nocardia transvalensis TaxID=37333 RepID=UPI0018955EB3|nr:hypothetical protein [Nocardia transvalensis]MBF6333321.1 hypothetical protein [Nocardia transvalensis]